MPEDTTEVTQVEALLDPVDLSGKVVIGRSGHPPDPQPPDTDTLAEADPEKPAWRRWLGKRH